MTNRKDFVPLSDELLTGFVLAFEEFIYRTPWDHDTSIRFSKMSFGGDDYEFVVVARALKSPSLGTAKKYIYFKTQEDLASAYSRIIDFGRLENYQSLVLYQYYPND